MFCMRDLYTVEVLLLLPVSWLLMENRMMFSFSKGTCYLFQRLQIYNNQLNHGAVFLAL